MSSVLDKFVGFVYPDPSGLHYYLHYPNGIETILKDMVKIGP